MKLTAEQNKAVSSNARRLLVASVAGSGKTTTLVARINYLISNGVSPEKILVLTFTNRMANELVEKLPMLHWVGNFHWLGLRLINESLISVREHTKRPVSESENREILLDIIKMISWKSSMREATKIIHDFYEGIEPRLRLGRVLIKKYTGYMKHHHLISFDMIEAMLLDRLIDNSITRSFTHILVDEFQDTTIREMKIIESMNPEFISVFGDVAQNIYEWRGTTIDNMLNFNPDETVNITETFRVPKNQVSLANHVLSDNDFNMVVNMKSSKPGPFPMIIEIDREEMKDELILSLKKVLSIYEPKDVMVLCRTNQQISDINIMLEGAFPVDAVQSAIGWNSQVGNMIMAFLRACIDKTDYTIERLISSAKLFDKDISNKLINHSQIEGIPLLELIEDMEDDGGATLLKQIMMIIEKKEPITKRVSAYYSAFIYPELSNNIYTEMSFESCMKSIQIYEETSHSVAGLITWLITLNTQDLISGDNSIKVLTYHTAKGLEAEAIILPWIEDGIFPRKPHSKDIFAEKRLFYVGITRAKSLLYILKTGNSIFLDEYMNN